MLKRSSTTTTINKLKLYIQRVGKPNAMLMDNGTQFTSNKWSESLVNINIKCKFTVISRAVPESEGTRGETSHGTPSSAIMQQ